MKYQIDYSNGGGKATEIVSADVEGELYKAVGQHLAEVAVPSTIEVRCLDNDGETAVFEVTQRGAYVVGGVTRPSIYVKEVNNTICLPASRYAEAYLVCVNAESNNYKYCHLMPQASGQIDVEYGRMGVEAGQMFGKRRIKEPYPGRMYWIRYYEKLSKGYVDRSSTYLETAAPKASKAVLPSVQETLSAALWKRLLGFAHKHVEETLTNANVTEAQVKEARRIFERMSTRKSVKGFNRQLLELLALSPRRASKVADLLARDTEEFPQIIAREESLILAMEAVASGHTTDKDGIAQAGITLFKATPEQEEAILGRLSPRLRQKVVHLWRVIDKPAKQRFEDYRKRSGFTHVREAFHGSRNENWASILTKRLQLYPDAAITGKMLGQCLYFAVKNPDGSEKSEKYTSLRGSYWAHGTSNTGFMGVYALAYHPKVIGPGDTLRSFRAAELKAMGCNCVHAQKGLYANGRRLYNDEIGVFDQDAVLINYLIEFTN